MKLGKYEFEIEDLEDLQDINGHHFALIIDDEIVVEIYDGVDADGDGYFSVIWAEVDGKQIDIPYGFIKEFRKEVEWLYY